MLRDYHCDTTALLEGVCASCLSCTLSQHLLLVLEEYIRGQIGCEKLQNRKLNP